MDERRCFIRMGGRTTLFYKDEWTDDVDKDGWMDDVVL